MTNGNSLNPTDSSNTVNLLSLPDEVLEIILARSGSRAAARTCKALANLWTNRVVLNAHLWTLTLIANHGSASRALDAGHWRTPPGEEDDTYMRFEESVAAELLRIAKPSAVMLNRLLCDTVTTSNAPVTRAMLRAGAIMSNSPVLNLAAYGRHADVVRLLLEAGCDVNSPSTDGCPLRIACKHRNLDVARVLLSAGARTDAVTTMEAIKSGHIGITKALLNAGALLPGGALKHAIDQKNDEMIRLLMGVPGANDDGAMESALVVAILQLNAPAVRMLIQAGADVHHGNVSDAMRDACLRGHAEIVVALVKAGADTAGCLSVAVRADQEKVVAVLLREGADATAAEVSGALGWAAIRGHMRIAKMLVDAGANATDALEADEIREREHVKLLVDLGADARANESQALRRAADKGNANVVGALIDAGADVHAHGNHALKVAVRKDHLKVVAALVHAGADVHVGGGHALFVASRYGHTAIVKILLRAGANPRARGCAALLEASCYGHIEAVLELLNVGADDFETRQKAMRLAINSGHAAVANILRRNLKKHGAV